MLCINDFVQISGSSLVWEEFTGTVVRIRTDYSSACVLVKLHQIGQTVWVLPTHLRVLSREDLVGDLFPNEIVQVRDRYYTKYSAKLDKWNIWKNMKNGRKLNSVVAWRRNTKPYSRWIKFGGLDESLGEQTKLDENKEN